MRHDELRDQWNDQPGPRRLVVWGARRNGRDVARAARAMRDDRGRPVYDVVGFVDDDASLHDCDVLGLPVLGGVATAVADADLLVAVAVGNWHTVGGRSGLPERVGIAPERWATVVDPRAVVGDEAELGRGAVVLHATYVPDGTALGDLVFVTYTATLGYDCTFGAGTMVSTGVCVAAGVTVGANCYVGANAVVIGNHVIGDRGIVGAGAVVTRDVAVGAVVAGNPARELRRDVD